MGSFGGGGFGPGSLGARQREIKLGVIVDNSCTTRMMKQNGASAGGRKNAAILQGFGASTAGAAGNRRDERTATCHFRNAYG
jgi:hypothetical protein